MYMRFVKTIRITACFMVYYEDVVRPGILEDLLRRVSPSILMPNLENVIVTEPVLVDELMGNMRSSEHSAFLRFLAMPRFLSAARHLIVEPDPLQPLRDRRSVPVMVNFRESLWSIRESWKALETITLHCIHPLDFPDLCDFRVPKYNLYLRAFSADEAILPSHSTRHATEAGSLTSFNLFGSPEVAGDINGMVREKEVVDQVRNHLLEEIEAQMGSLRASVRMEAEQRGQQ